MDFAMAMRGENVGVDKSGATPHFKIVKPPSTVSQDDMILVFTSMIF
jgi:hypothetical protein